MVRMRTEQTFAARSQRSGLDDPMRENQSFHVLQIENPVISRGVQSLLFLFIGMIASGISARVTLLSHRGGWFLEDQAGKSSGMVIFDLLGTVSGIAAFVISFLLFDWWWPLIALAVGYWFVAPFVVTRTSYAFFYQTQFATALVALICSLAIFGIYFEIL